jgi:membrane protein DedA with SNARE-associated domain
MVIVEGITNIIINFIEVYGYSAVFIWMMLDNLNIPVIPSEVILLFSGYMAYLGRLDFFLVGIIGTLGGLVGSLISYYIGYYGGIPFIKKYGKYFFVSAKDLKRAERWFGKYGSLTVCFSRLIPLVRTFISIPAGIGKMKIKKFISYTFLGSVIWSYFISYIGFSLGPNWDILINYIKSFEVLIIIVVLFLLVIILRKPK